jgi:hypothetical protein
MTCPRSFPDFVLLVTRHSITAGSKAFNRGLFPLPTLLAFIGTAGLSVTLDSLACLSRGSSWSPSNHRQGFPCCVYTLCLHAVAITPAGVVGSVSLVPIPSPSAFPASFGRSAPALTFSRPAQRSLTLRPARSPSRLNDPLHRRLRRFCFLHRRSDCFRVERTSSRAGLAPAGVQRLSRRTNDFVYAFLRAVEL